MIADFVAEHSRARSADQQLRGLALGELRICVLLFLFRVTLAHTDGEEPPEEGGFVC